MWRHDQLHQGVSSETILSASSALKLDWSVNTATAGTTTLSYSSPAVVYNSTLNKSLVYVGNQQGEMNAYDAATGSLVWSFPVPKTTGLSKDIETSPAVSNSVLYFGAGDYHEYALNATTGTLICTSQSVGGVIAASPTVADPDGKGDVVYFGDSGPSGTLSDGGHEWAMYGVGNTAGSACSTKWMFDGFGSPAGSQTGISGTYSSQAYGLLADGTPVVTFGSSDPDDAIYELNASTGAELWRFQAPVLTDSDIGAPPTIAAPHTIGAVGSQTYNDGVVYDTAKSAFTYALDLKTGSQIWVFDIRTVIGHGNPTQSGASLVGGTIYLGYGAGVFSLDAGTGALGWTTTSGSGVVSSPSISGPAGNQVIFVGDLSGIVHAINLATGADLFTYATTPGCSPGTVGCLIFASAAVSTGQFFISSSNGFLYAFGQNNGGPPPPPFKGLYTLDAYGGINPDDSAPVSAPSYWPGWNIARAAKGLPGPTAPQSGLVLDGFGGLHPYGTPAPSETSGSAGHYWGFDIARDFAFMPDGSGGLLLDGYGGLHGFGVNGGVAPAPTPGYSYFGSDVAVKVVIAADGKGGYVLDAYGGVHPFGINGNPAPPAVQNTGYWNWRAAQDMALIPGQNGGYQGFVLDKFGGLHPFIALGSTLPAVPTTSYFGFNIARGIFFLSGSSTQGYTLDGYGGLHPFGGAPAIVSHAYWPGKDIAKSLFGA